MTPFIYADGDLSPANVQTVVMAMGSKHGKMFFNPNHINFKTGQAYQFVLKNVDKIKHEVEVQDKNGDLLAEIKGAVREVEVGPMQEVE